MPQKSGNSYALYKIRVHSSTGETIHRQRIHKRGNSAEFLFDGLLNIISRIKDLPLSAQTVGRHISVMAGNVNMQQSVALTNTQIAFVSVAVDESVCEHQ